MVDTMRGGVYSRAWYVLVFFTGPVGFVIAWLILHRRDGFHKRGLLIWLWLWPLAMVACVAASFVWASVTDTVPFGYQSLYAAAGRLP